MTAPKFEQLFGGPPRQAESALGQREMDIAASIQSATEEILLRMVRHIHQRTGMRNLCLAGGVALNCVANGRIMREGPFEKIWIQPAAGDAGGALGAALFTWHQLLEKPRNARTDDSQCGSLLGPSFSSTEIKSLLDREGASYVRYDDESELCDAVAAELECGHVVGWFQGRMEFGPRALGSRSILGDARDPDMQKRMNLKIKFRESFRPFAPSVLSEQAADYFLIKPDTQSPYMLLVAPILESKRIEPQSDEAKLEGLDRLNAQRSEVPAITHVDFSARVQTVDKERHGRYRLLLDCFAARTGCPMLINTSFNVRGEPIVCTPEDAYRCFLATDMDVLVLENMVLRRQEQTVMSAADQREYVSQFHLD